MEIREQESFVLIVTYFLPTLNYGPVYLKKRMSINVSVTVHGLMDDCVTGD